MTKFSEELEKLNYRDMVHAIYMTMKAIVLVYLLNVSIDWLREQYGALFLIFPTVGYLFSAYLIASRKESSDDQ